MPKLIAPTLAVIFQQFQSLELLFKTALQLKQVEHVVLQTAAFGTVAGAILVVDLFLTAPANIQFLETSVGSGRRPSHQVIITRGL